MDIFDKIPEMKEPNDALGMARTEPEIWRAGFRLISVAILVASDYDVSVPKPEEEQ
jgi:hypothetical protein